MLSVAISPMILGHYAASFMLDFTITQSIVILSVIHAGCRNYANYAKCFNAE